MTHNIVIMHSNSSLYNTLYDSISSQYNCIVLKPLVSEFKKIPEDINIDLFIIDLKGLAKADILYLCDNLNTKSFAVTPIIYSGPYSSNTIFASKVSPLRKTKYITDAEFSDLPNDISMIFSGADIHTDDNTSKEPAIKPAADNANNAQTNSQDNSHAVTQSVIPDKQSPAIPVKVTPDKKTVLVIDDDVNILTSVAKYIGKEYTVISVRTTALAFMKMGVKKPDLILLDYMMPICNGMQTLEMIRKQFETSKIPVIMLTSFTEKESVLQCFELGVSGYLVKPVSKEDLLETVHKVLS